MSEVPRLLVFGSTGQGKSSLINLLGDLTGSAAAEVGHGAGIGTFESKEYEVISPDRKKYVLVDTAGLNEADGKVTKLRPSDAADNLLKLLRESTTKGFCLAIVVLKAERFEVGAWVC